MKIRKRYQQLVRDVLLLIASVAFAVWLARTGTAESLVGDFSGYVFLACIIAGFFFTSLFTLAPASIALAVLGQSHPHEWVALWGAAGAVLGDILLFIFVRERVSDDMAVLFSNRRWSWLRRAFKRPFLHWLLPITGALVIASPLPDELGLAMMGISRISLSAFVPISYAMNFLGILLMIFLAGKAL